MLHPTCSCTEGGLFVTKQGWTKCTLALTNHCILKTFFDLWPFLHTCPLFGGVCYHFDLKLQQHSQLQTWVYLCSAVTTKVNSTPRLCLSRLDGFLYGPLCSVGVQLCFAEREDKMLRCFWEIQTWNGPPQAVNRGQGQIPGCQMWGCGAAAVAMPVAGCTSWPCGCVHTPIMTVLLSRVLLVARRQLLINVFLGRTSTVWHKMFSQHTDDRACKTYTCVCVCAGAVCLTTPPLHCSTVLLQLGPALLLLLSTQVLSSLNSPSSLPPFSSLFFFPTKVPLLFFLNLF